MALGKPKEFNFHTYWLPEEETIQLGKIGNLRPPNELIEEALEVLKNQNIDYKDQSDSDPVYIGMITVGFVYVPGEPDKKQIDRGMNDFENRLRVETGTMVGEEVASEFETRDYADNIDEMYEPYEDKGWLTINGDYYIPDDEKPEGWSSR